MKKHGHYCKVCGEYKANEKISGKGHAAHICKSCASLSPEKQAEQMTVPHETGRCSASSDAGNHSRNCQPGWI